MSTKKKEVKESHERLYATLNKKMIFSRFTNNLVYFTDENIEEVPEERILDLGYKVISDGINMIDYEDNCMDDLSNMYGLLKPQYSNDPNNLLDFYVKYGAFNDDISEDDFINALSKFQDRKNPIKLKKKK